MRNHWKFKPDYFESNLNMGLVLVAQGKVGESEKYLIRATQLNPGNASAHNELGLVYAALGKFKMHLMNIKSN